MRGDLDWIVMKALEKDRDAPLRERPTASRDDIQRHLRQRAGVSRGAADRSTGFESLRRRNKVGAGDRRVHRAGRWSPAPSSVHGSRSARRGQSGSPSTEASKSRQVAQFLKDMLKGVGPSVALGRDTKMLREILDKTAERVGKDLKDQPEVEAELRNTLGEVYYELGDLAKAEPLYREALAIRTKLYGNEHLEVAESLDNLALVLEDQNKLAEAEAMMREALRIERALLGSDHPQVAVHLSNLSLLFACRPRFQRRKRCSATRWRCASGTWVRTVPDVAVSMNILALILQDQGKLDEAETLQRQALDIQRSRSARPIHLC